MCGSRGTNQAIEIAKSSFTPNRALARCDSCAGSSPTNLHLCCMPILSRAMALSSSGWRREQDLEVVVAKIGGPARVWRALARRRAQWFE